MPNYACIMEIQINTQTHHVIASEARQSLEAAAQAHDENEIAALRSQ